MTYSQGGPGYQPGQPPTQFGAPTQSFGKVGAGEPAGPSKLPLYLLAAVAVLGLAVYLVSFGPVAIAIGFAVIAALIAALLAGASLLPKQKSYLPVIAAISIMGFLLGLAELINKPSGGSVGWAAILIIVLTALQAATAVGALLLDAGVITAPAPRPKYEQPQYGQYGPGQYYGQPSQQAPPFGGSHQQLHAPQQHAAQQRPGYPSQYGGYPSGPSTGGFSALGPQSGPPTPPTGFPSFSPPQPSSAAPTAAVPVQPAQQSSTPDGPPPPS